MATKRVCDRCGAEINPTSSATYVNVRSAFHEKSPDIELCCSCAMQIKEWLNQAVAEEQLAQHIENVKDWVPVVRCKDCKMWGKQNIFEHSNTGRMRRGGYCCCSRFIRYEDEFCSSGEYQTNTAENQPTPSGKKVALFDLGEVQESMEGNR